MENNDTGSLPSTTPASYPMNTSKKRKLGRTYATLSFNLNAEKIYITTNIHPRQWYDWSTREQQYPALIRRFTMVFWWKQSGTESTLIPRPDVDNTDEELWKHFWNPPGPRGGYIRPNGHMEIENTVDPYDF